MTEITREERDTLARIIAQNGGTLVSAHHWIERAGLSVRNDLPRGSWWDVDDTDNVAFVDDSHHLHEVFPDGREEVFGPEEDWPELTARKMPDLPDVDDLAEYIYNKRNIAPHSAREISELVLKYLKEDK